MEYRTIGPKIRSSHDFLVYYFNNIMEIGCDDFNWPISERVKEMRELIEVYRSAFRLQAYSDVSIWKRIKKLYWRNWCTLHYDMMEYERKIYLNKLP